MNCKWKLTRNSSKKHPTSHQNIIEFHEVKLVIRHVFSLHYAHTLCTKRHNSIVLLSNKRKSNTHNITGFLTDYSIPQKASQIIKRRRWSKWVMINWKELGKQASWPNGGSIPTCSQGDWGKPQKFARIRVCWPSFESSPWRSKGKSNRYFNLPSHMSASYGLY